MPPRSSTAERRKMPTRTAPAKRKAAAPARAPKRKKAKITAAGRSVWNSTDDWDQLVADSQLSTSSISRRRPRPRGLQSLVKCASEAAVRGFKRLWEETVGPEWVTESGTSRGRVWQDWWSVVPDHLKVGIRDAIFERWGGLLDADMITQVSAEPLTGMFTDVRSSLYRPRYICPRSCYPPSRARTSSNRSGRPIWTALQRSSSSMRPLWTIQRWLARCTTCQCWKRSTSKGALWRETRPSRR